MKILTLHPGQRCTRSGQWTCRWVSKGARKRRQSTVTRGERMPPLPRGKAWKLTDRTRHQRA